MNDKKESKKERIVNHYNSHAELPRVSLSFDTIDSHISVESSSYDYGQAFNGCYILYKKLKRKPRNKFR